MYELQVGCLSKINQQAIGAAMELVTRSGSTKLGPGRAIASNKRGPFQTFGRVLGQRNLPVSECS
jgi:hypothetical protein